MDFNSILAGFREFEASFFSDELLSLGYSQQLANATSEVNASLMRGARALNQGRFLDFSEELFTQMITIGTSTSDTDTSVLRHDENLSARWSRFADALASSGANRRYYIGLALRGVDLEGVFDQLLLSFNTAPLLVLVLANNDLRRNGLTFAVSAVKASATLTELEIENNRIKYQDNVKALVQALKEHSELTSLKLKNCGIGLSKSVMTESIQALKFLASVDLSGNSIGPQGASLIAGILAKNPRLEELILQRNVIDDSGAIVIAGSLKTNTNLKSLELAENKFTSKGIMALTKALFNPSSMNTIYDSNHTCKLGYGLNNDLGSNNNLIQMQK